MRGGESKRRVPEGARPLLFLAFFVLAVWPALYAMHRAPAVMPWAFRDTVRSPAFQAGQWNDPLAGCGSLIVQDRLDILIVGNSHALGGVDLYALSAADPERTFGICAWPAWDSSYFGSLTVFLDRWDVSVDRIVWIADTGSLSDQDSELRNYLRGKFETYLEDQAEIGASWLRWLARDRLRSAPLGVTLEDYSRRLERLAAASARLDPQTVDAIIAANHLAGEEQILATARQLGSGRRAEFSAHLDAFCAALETRDIALDVVIYPIPDSTLAMLSEALNESPPDMVDELRRELPCLGRMIVEPLDNWGLDLRHFTNLESASAPAVWEDPDSFAERYGLLPEAERIALFDANHLNLLGANIFTRHLAQVLQPSTSGKPAMAASPPPPGPGAGAGPAAAPSRM